MTDEPQPAPDRPATTAAAFLQAERLRRTPVHEQQPVSGAVFAREVGADPAKWAREFLAAYAQAEGVRTDADRLAFVTQWMRDAMNAAARDGGLQMLASFEVGHREIEPPKPMENTMLREVLGGLRIALAAHERGEADEVMSMLKVSVKRLSIATDDTNEPGTRA